MSGVFGNPWLYNANPPFYDHTIDQSLRFNDGDGAYLNRTPASAGNQRLWTFSAWAKKSTLDVDGYLLGVNSSSAPEFIKISNSSTDQFEYAYWNGSVYVYQVRATALLRDTSAWYHIVLAVDTAQSTAANRVKFYVNGTQLTDFSISTYPTQNADTRTNAAVDHRIGSGIGGAYYDGYIAEVNFIDGAALTPSSFGETKDGIWIPKDTSGLTFGTNGFYLPFDDSSAIGDDESGNTNDWTANNLAARMIVPDSPTNNFATLNPLYSSISSSYPTPALSEGNLAASTSSGSNWKTVPSTMYMSTGKWYAEVRVTYTDYVDSFIGFASSEFNGQNYAPSETAFGYQFHPSLGIRHNSTQLAAATFTQNDIIGLALNMDDNEIKFYKNGTLVYTATSVAAGSWSVALTLLYTKTLYANFGQDSTFAGGVSAGGNADGNGVGDFKHPVPSGFLALASSNFPEPSIIDGSKHFNTVIWTGTGSGVTRSISGVGFRPDFSWSKNRTQNYSNILYDAVRGTGSEAELQSNDTAKQGDGNNDTYGYLSSFDSDGFTSTAGSGGNSQNLYFNEASQTYVAWNWKAGGAAPTKTYKVVVVSDSGNKYRFRNSADDATYAASAVTLDLQEGGTYTFDQSDSSNSGHPFRFYTAADKSGGEYTTGVTTSGTAGSAGATVTIILAASAPTLYYQCSAHAGMGGQINTNSTYGSTNFDGTLIATVSANVEAGFSIARWTGNAVDNTVIPHGLGGAADLVITKSQTIVAGAWLALHSNIASETNNVIILNQITAATNGSSTLTDGCPDELTSVGVKLVRGTGSSMNAVNGSGRSYIAYCFKNVDGYLKCGGYTGNGADDGTFVFTGGRPKLLMVRRTTNADNWVIDDSTRSPFNEMNNTLYANIVNDEYTGGLYGIDFLSNGFKIRDNDGNYNASGNNYVYLCIMETPQKYSNAR